MYFYKNETGPFSINLYLIKFYSQRYGRAAIDFNGSNFYYPSMKISDRPIRAWTTHAALLPISVFLAARTPRRPPWIFARIKMLSGQAEGDTRLNRSADAAPK